jgi:hypothetical protein
MANRVTIATTIVAVPSLSRLGRRASLTTRRPSPARTISRQLTTALEKGRKPSGGAQPKPLRQSLTTEEAALYAKLNNRKGANRQQWSVGAVRTNPALVGPYAAFTQGGKSQKLEWEETATGERITVRLRSSVLPIVTGLAARGYEVMGRRASDIKRVVAVYVSKHRKARDKQIRTIVARAATSAAGTLKP